MKNNENNIEINPTNESTKLNKSNKKNGMRNGSIAFIKKYGIVFLIFIITFILAFSFFNRNFTSIKRELFVVDNIRKIGRFEVLRFSISEPYIYKANSVEYIAEYIGIGEYSIDFENVEIFYDEKDNYFRVEIPDVQITSFNIVDSKDIYFSEIRLKHSKDYGVDLYYESKKEGSIKLEERAYANLSFKQKARDNAKIIISDLIKTFSKNPDLEVDVVIY